ncbi:iron sulfur assembly protein 1 [Talaromyces proteolyticus]|uniref:Iron-sulfur assembly protein 1 n=1 Tax=Talaromyces proteolyticus TaxID=1131652 RepID=A0AAD4Q0X9_9EURO|nr:iron sulfur assembly protein 1 [Talaromyces proteolyticus]KAH8697683.1 iron sulfur assembly protein 1 [Talaromyces proteolyticus]
MSASVALRPSMTSSAATMFKYARASATTGCKCTVRLFCSYRPNYQSSRRDMQTATAFQPHTLQNNFPPPRNAGIPDTSIAADAPFNTEKSAYNAAPSSDRQSSISAREGETQRSSPVQSASTTSTTTTSSTNPRRSRLRPRKAAMTLTSTAVAQLKTLLSQPDPKMIRVGVKNRGCSGLAYALEYVEKPGKFDEVVEQEGVKVLIDSKALFSIIGSEMDWQEDKLSQRFVFRNPNIKEQCGCGESFMV